MIITADARVGVLLPLVFDAPFDYLVPHGMTLSVGDYVRVPFGKRSLWGVVWGAGAGDVAVQKLKTVEQVAVHLPGMRATLRAFIDWVAWYTLAPRGMVLKMTLSQPDALAPPAVLAHYRLAPAHSALRLTPARARIIAYLADGIPRTLKDIAAHARVTPAVLREFLSGGGLMEVSDAVCIAPAPLPPTSGIAARPVLSADQTAATLAIAAKIGAGFSVSVLDGVTGSGKTEVYFDAIERCLAQGKQALVLLPEIALSVQWLSRFAARFGFAPDLWHSGVSAGKKKQSWRAAAQGAAQVVVGARSALFLPYKALGLIVVDEEHDGSYKQEDGVIYHARDMAVARARHEQVATLLVSATPSLETEYNIHHGRYARLHLLNRHGEAQLPQVRLIDMRAEKLERGSWLSAPLKQALGETIARGHQAMLFINRRGYAPLMLCRACGHRFQCPHCSASLVVHRARGLLCHHCGYQISVPQSCPACNQSDTLMAYGPGVERIAEEARTLLPGARIALMTSDAMRLDDKDVTPDVLIRAMSAGEIDVLIGTQMIAKGHDFAGLAFVGVVDGDMGLAGGDLRAGERTYQLLHQLSGRAGRAHVAGEVWLQTFLPDHPVMQALAQGDRAGFLALEHAMRKNAQMPPYGKLASIIVEGKSENEVAAYARALLRSDLLMAPNSPCMLGPAPAPMFLLRGHYRYRILVKAARDFSLQPFLARWLGSYKHPATIRIKTDVDPYSFM